MTSLSKSSRDFQVSVVIPTYNRLTFLQRAIESVRQQTTLPFEIIVVDDGSTDDTQSWLQQQTDIITVWQRNQGVSHARNRGIEISTGHWIAFLDSDDRWFPDKLEQQLRAVQEQPGYRLCHCDEHWIRRGRRVNPKNKHQKSGGDIFNACLPLCAISPSAAMLKKELLDDVGLFDESLPACEDYDLWLRITVQEPVLYIDQPLLEKYGGHDDQLSQHYSAMDRFRLFALAKLLRSGKANAQQQPLAQAMFQQKLNIYLQGARKRDRNNTVAETLASYHDLIDSSLLP